MHSWDAGQYLRFAGERTRPAQCGGAVLLLYPRLFFIATPRRRG